VISLGILAVCSGCGNVDTKTGSKKWIDWAGDTATEIKRDVVRQFNKFMDEQKVSLKQSTPMAKNDQYLVEIEVTIVGSKSGKFIKTYTDIESDKGGDLTETGKNSLKQRIEADKKEFQNLQW
jgi:hypothetical protein